MKDWDDEFGPSFTPEQMIKLGIFNGVYDNRPPDSANNHFGVTANMNIKVRIDGVLVTKPNLSFWFEWYRGYYDGLRTDKDTWYIKNWKSLVHTLSNKEPSDKYSQQLLQLGWDNLQEFTDDNVYNNVAVITGRRLTTEGFGVNQATDLLKLGVGVYEITKQVQSLNTGTKSSKKKKRGGGKFSISPTLNPLAYLPYVTVEEKDGFVTVTGFSTKQFANGLDRLLKTSRFKNIFTSMSSRSFVVESFFVIEVIRSIDLLLSNGSNMSNGSLESLKEKLITNTWVGGLKDAEPRKFNYDRLSRLTVSLLPKQMQFLNEYETVTPLLGLNGWLLAAAPGTGKAVVNGTPVKVPVGWCPIEELSVGDKVMGDDGQLTTVSGVYPQGVVDLYKITFYDGRTATVCKDHLWKINDGRLGRRKPHDERWHVTNTEDIYNYYYNNKRFRCYIPLTEPLDSPELNLPLDPYCLGVLLGDGTLGKSGIFVHKPDRYVLDRFISEYGDMYPIRELHRDGKYVGFRISHSLDKTIPSLQSKLDDIGLLGAKSRTKFIPPVYLEGSINQRLELVRGLMDTDGTVDIKTGTPSYCSMSIHLATGLQKLIRSLGGIAKLTEKKVSYKYINEPDTKVAYILTLRSKRPWEYFNLERKRSLTRVSQYSENLKLSIVNIEPVEAAEATCISVTNESKLFVIKDYIVTHNTISGFSWHLVNEFDCTIFVVPNNSVEKVWENTILTYFKDNPKYFISRDGFKIKGDEEFIVCHYEYLDKLLAELPKVKAKRIGLWVDESHNFNELTSQRTNNLIYLSQTYAEATVEASGTPLKQQGKELVPLFRMIDKLFTPTVEASFIKTFGSTTGTVLELLNYRANRASFKVAKSEVVNNVVNERSVSVKIPDPTPYHLETVMSEIRVFCKEKLTSYVEMKPSIEVEYFKFIENYKNNCKDIGDFATYISGTKEMHTKFSPYTHIELIKQCSKYEKEYIMPFLHPTDRKVFKKASALYKYPILVVRGQALGRILTRRRIECSVAMVPYAGIEDIVSGAKKKTVIFTNYVDVVIAIGEHLKEMGIKPILVYGDTNKDLSANLGRFLKDPKANPIVATYNSLSTAVPLIEASSIYLHDSPFRQYIIEQAIARLDRYGQDTDVDVLRGALDTGEIPNLSTRSIDIAAMSKEMVDAILDLEKIDDRMLSTEGFGYPDEVEGCDIKDEYTFDSVLTSESFYESHSDRHASNWGDDRDKLFTIMLNNSREMYHVSFDELPPTLKPRLPDGSVNGNKSHHSYEPDIKRVCFSDSVIGAIRAVYPNYQRMFEHDKPVTITWKLYKVSVGTKGQWVPPYALTEAGFVDDAHITREYWNMVDVSPVHVGDIDVHMDFDNGYLKYKPFDKGNHTINHSPIDIVVDYTNTKLYREDYSATSGGVFIQPLKPLYIASMVELKSDTLSPEYPSGSKFAKQRKAKDSYMYDAAEERVAAHGSICGAVRSLWADNRDIVEVHGSGFPIYVYEVNRPNMYDWVSPSELARNRAVWDANITHVYWTHETVKLSPVEECWAEWEVDGQWAFIQINGDEQTMEHSPLTLRVVRKDGTVESDRSKNHNSIDISGYNLRLEV